MNRENFEIKMNDKLAMVKHKWNSSVRFTESRIAEIAKAERCNYRLTLSISTKGETGHYSGCRVWTSATGRVVRFDIAKVE